MPNIRLSGKEKKESTKMNHKNSKKSGRPPPEE